MAQTKIFRDRVVSLEQTQEIGEKNLDLLTEIVLEALPGFERVDFTLEHEADLFCLLFRHPETGLERKVSFTRMFLSDAGRLPAVVDNPAGPVRARVVEIIRGHASRAEIAVTLRQLLTEEEQTEADAIDAEWRKKEEALLAARRAEEERKAREKRRLKQIEEQRRAEKRKRERQAQAEKRAQQPGGRPQQPKGDRRPQQQRPAAAQPGGTPTPSPRAEAGARQAQQPQQTPQGQGGRRRRRRRGRGGSPPQGAPSAPRGDAPQT